MSFILTHPQGIRFCVDEADYERCVQHRWRISAQGYPVYGDNIPVYVLLLGKPPEGKVTDHIDRNKLNNRRSNLRFVSYAINSANRKHLSNPNFSIFRQAGKFRVRLTRYGQQYQVGYFDTIEIARHQRDIFVKTYFPETVCA